MTVTQLISWTDHEHTNRHNQRSSNHSNNTNTISRCIMSERNDILKCRSASTWLKNQLDESAQRDPIDLMHDLIILKRVIESEYDQRAKRSQHLTQSVNADLITHNEYKSLLFC